MKLKDFKKLKIPSKSGVYFFKKGKEIFYIGKATSLKERVKSYFGKDLINTRGPVILDMVFKANKITWEVADNVLEALILEANLIKKYQPKYNTKEKSDKSFNYVCITKEKLPRVLMVRGKQLEHSQGRNFSQVLGKNPQTIRKTSSLSAGFGPYTSGTQLRDALKIIRKIFPFLDDKSKNYLEFYRQINLVPDLGDRKMYLQNIRNLKLFFAGKKKEVLRNLKKEMQNYAKNHEFEKAGEIKRQLFAIKHINDIALLKQDNSARMNFFSLRTAEQLSSLEKIHTSPVFRIEAYDIAHMGGKNMVGVMTVVEDGRVNKNEYKKFKIRSQADSNDTGALREVLERRFKHTEWVMPNLVVVDGSTAQINVAESVLKMYGLHIPVVSVVKDEKHKMKEIKGNNDLIKKYKAAILLANSEAHRFAINYHKNLRNKNFLK
ncbi:MAG: UvrB/UvrC motif-containing protein [Candidatus Paceibacterota bacterium]|jgi:excinuclease ABC subunit C